MKPTPPAIGLSDRQACLNSPTGRHAAVRAVYGAGIDHPIGDPNRCRAVCRYCAAKLERAHSRSSVWVTAK